MIYIDVLAWMAAAMLTVRGLCVLNHMSGKSNPLFRATLILMTISGFAIIVSPVYGDVVGRLGYGAMIVSTALVCIFDKRRFWTIRRRWPNKQDGVNG